jgi:hypothetical protein
MMAIAEIIDADLFLAMKHICTGLFKNLLQKIKR